MSDLSLERRCRRLVRAYPPGPRAEEVLTTLLEANAGRSAPRVADAADVVRHGLAARLRTTAAGTRYGRWVTRPRSRWSPRSWCRRPGSRRWRCAGSCRRRS